MSTSFMEIPRMPGRKPLKQGKIAAYLRASIMGGKWGAGEKIPSRAVLEKQFGVSSVTIQRTLDSLVGDGFLRVVPNRGTFVNEKQPYLLNFALALPQLQQSGIRENEFFRKLQIESRKIQAELGIKIITYHDVIGQILTEDAIRLVKDIRAEKLAGIVFGTAIFSISDSPIVREKKIPRLIIATGPSESPRLPAISTDQYSFIDKSLDYLCSSGRRRIALMSPPGQSLKFIKYFKDGLKRRNCFFLEPWHQMCPLVYPQIAVNIIGLLMSESNSEKPNGLVVSDDNLIESVCEGLRMSGMKTPEDIEVVSHCNFPNPPLVERPVKYIGYDADEILRTSIAILKLLGGGKKVSPLTVVRARTDDEYNVNIRRRNEIR